MTQPTGAAPRPPHDLASPHADEEYHDDIIYPDTVAFLLAHLACVGVLWSGVTARAGDETVRADVLVGADGANGVVARSVGLGDAIVRGVALEGNVPLDALALDLERTAVIELAALPGGYGWIFPKGDHANLGVGGWGTEGPRLRGHR